MKITAERARQVFYQAAANIEARPDSYRFESIKVGGVDCPACLWGHVGQALGFSADKLIGRVCDALDMDSSDMYFPGSFDGVAQGFDHKATNFSFSAVASFAAQRLRAFADLHWPAGTVEAVNPDMVECGQSFIEMIESFGNEVVL